MEYVHRRYQYFAVPFVDIMGLNDIWHPFIIGTMVCQKMQENHHHISLIQPFSPHFAFLTKSDKEITHNLLVYESNFGQLLKYQFPGLDLSGIGLYLGYRYDFP